MPYRSMGRSAARRPAETASQPSTGQDVERTEREMRFPVEPYSSRVKRWGVAAAEVSSQRTPVIPTRTTGRSPSEAGAGVAVVGTATRARTNRRTATSG